MNRLRIVSRGPT